MMFQAPGWDLVLLGATKLSVLSVVLCPSQLPTHPTLSTLCDSLKYRTAYPTRYGCGPRLEARASVLQSKMCDTGQTVSPLCPSVSASP